MNKPEDISSRFKSSDVHFGPRPRGALKNRAPCTNASGTVRSELPPSTTMISFCPGSRWRLRSLFDVLSALYACNKCLMTFYSAKNHPANNIACRKPLLLVGLAFVRPNPPDPAKRGLAKLPGGGAGSRRRSCTGRTGVGAVQEPAADRHRDRLERKAAYRHKRLPAEYRALYDLLRAKGESETS